MLWYTSAALTPTENREDQRGDPRVARLHVFDQVQAVTALEDEIDNHQIGLAGPDGVERSAAGGGFPADDYAWLGLDQGGEPATQHGVIVDDQNLPLA